ncbi:MAG: putative thymidylate kinase [Parcubacteria group bacterium GW2011_GWB1_52_7]|nr:MAG: putative thymidylate kinase [Parcubacteria group bacterium GW2011_GWB1_52_7]
MPENTGYFIAFEGIDGCGKSSVLPLVERRLAESGFKCLITHEPRRESPWGRKIYKILHGELPMISNLELQKLYVEDRYDHVVNEIKPALRRGEIVLADRYWLSTLAYGMISNALDDLINLHNEIFNGDFLKPDITFVFDLPAKTALERLKNISKGNDHFEQIDKLSLVRKNYLALCQTVNANCAVVDASRSLDSIADTILLQLLPRLPARKTKEDTI